MNAASPIWPHGLSDISLGTFVPAATRPPGPPADGPEARRTNPIASDASASDGDRPRRRRSSKAADRS